MNEIQQFQEQNKGESVFSKQALFFSFIQSNRSGGGGQVREVGNHTSTSIELAYHNAGGKQII